MKKTTPPYPRKALYFLLTLPMIALYAVVAVFLWQKGIVYTLIYLALFVIVALAQSLVCVYWACPYLGRFGPCVGGFCLPSNLIARLYRGASITKRVYHIAVTLACLAFGAIFLFPVYFLYQQSVTYLLIYMAIILIYSGGFLGLICPVCATRGVCPAGQISTKIRKEIMNADGDKEEQSSRREG
ncbi:MAG: hypothetical protein R6U57_08190 [Anaerolineales bacterium]